MQVCFIPYNVCLIAVMIKLYVCKYKTTLSYTIPPAHYQDVHHTQGAFKLDTSASI